MAIVKLGAHLPDGDKNGLVRIAPHLVDDPHAAHVVIAIVDCKQTTTNADDDTTTPLARIRHIEPLSSEEDIAAATGYLRRAFEQRTGKVELPFDLVQDAERVTLADRDQLPEASELSEKDGDHETALEEAAERSGPDVDDVLPPVPAGEDKPEWEYPEGEGPEEAKPVPEAADNVRAFSSPFRASGA